MRIFVTVTGSLLLLGASFSYLGAAQPPGSNNIGMEANHQLQGNPQSSCPLMGGHIEQHDMWVDVKGKRIYICCAACEDAIRTEPDKYIKIIEDRGEVIETVPGT